MAEESQGRRSPSPTPDSIVETVTNDNEASSEVISESDRNDGSTQIEIIKDPSKPSTSDAVDYTIPDKQLPVTNFPDRDRPVAAVSDVTQPRLSLNRDIQLPGSSSSAFRPFVSEPIVLSPENTSNSPTQSQLVVTPVSRRQTIPGSTVPQTSESPNLDNSLNTGESSSANEDNDDGRTTASAPPCTPAPEPHIQIQSPFRNSRPIKRIDLLAMSRSRQSDRAENARRDGRLAPSPRKKDEVLRNSGYLFPTNRSYSFHQNARGVTNEGFISPERVSNGASSAASPNVDVVSVDDQNDALKYKLSIQFHNLEHDQMMKCNLCGFVTNNQRFYRRHRRLHSRQQVPNQIQCSQCDYSTTQIRRMREHTMTHQNLSQTASSNPHFRSSTISDSNQNPPFQGHFFIPNGTIYPPNTRPITLPLSAVPSSIMSNTVSLGGLHTFVPTAATGPQEPQPQVPVNGQMTLHHPPRGSAMLGNCNPNSGEVTSYMRSFLSNLMTPPTRTVPTSTVTSSNLYQSVPQESQSLNQSTSNPTGMEDSFNMGHFWNHRPNNGGDLSSRSISNNSSLVKIKMEPRHGSVSQITRVNDLPSSTQQDRTNMSPHRGLSDNLDDESPMDIGGNDHSISPRLPTYIDSQFSAGTSTDTNPTDSAREGDLRDSISSQYPMPFIKIEFPSNSEQRNWLHNNNNNNNISSNNNFNCSNSNSSRRQTVAYSERGVQCDIISMSSHRSSSGRTQSETVSSAGGSVECKCHYCGVTFDDEVIHSIHVGCHSHTDPFVCNVCGKQCHNKYGFYSHIMRGHHSRPNNAS